MNLIANAVFFITLCNYAVTHRFIFENLDLYDRIDAWKAVQEYCNGKTLTNFCSNAHLKLVMDIVRKKKAEMEEKRKLKQMKNDILNELIKIITAASS